MFGPAAAANFRSNLLRSGNLPDAVLRRIDTPTLILSSAKDRMLPSLAEGKGWGWGGGLWLQRVGFAIIEGHPQRNTASMAALALARCKVVHKRYSQARLGSCAGTGTHPHITLLLPLLPLPALPASGARLARVLPRSRRAILPDSGHAALLERGMDLATIMRGAGVTARPRQHKQHVQQPQQQPGQQPMAAPSTQQQPAAQAAASAAPAGPASMETVRVRLPDSSGNKSRKGRSSSMPRIIGVVKDDKALPGSRGTDGAPAPRPATLLPRTTKVAAAAAEGAAVSSSSSEAPQFTPLAAAGAAAAMAAATAGSGGPAATAAADAGGSSSLAQAAASSNGAGSRSSSRAGSRSGSPDGQQQQQKAQQAAAADKDLAWDEWSQILAPWRVSANAAAQVHCYFKQCARMCVCTQGGMLHGTGGFISQWQW